MSVTGWKWGGNKYVAANIITNINGLGVFGGGADNYRVVSEKALAMTCYSKAMSHLVR